MIFRPRTVEPQSLAASSEGLSAAERRRRNDAGRHNSGCGRCGDKWNWKQHHDTWLGATGMFPLCEECWLALGTPEKRYPFYEALITQWEADGMSKEEGAEQRALALKALKGEPC